MGALPLIAVLLLSACAGTSNLDWDLRNNAGNTSSAVERATDSRPSADGNGVISYPGYQVVVARRGDTVGSVASRLGLSAGQLASFNALQPDDNLRPGEVLALPVRVAAQPAGIDSTAGGTGALIPDNGAGGATSGGIDVEAIATTAIDRVDSGAAAQPGAKAGAQTGSTTRAGALPFSTKGSGAEPVRYQVKRGETAFTIARQFNISAKALADWNGLGPDLSVREGQYLIIPTPTDSGRATAATTDVTTLPGEGSPTPEPPSAKLPLPAEKTMTAAEAAKQTPAAPDLGAQRTKASASAMGMPVDGKIILGFGAKLSNGKGNQGIDIAASAGSAVHSAQDGSVAVITHDPVSGSLILIVKHEGGLLTVYKGLDSASVAKGATVKRGQTLGTVKSGAPAQLHFEVRQGQQAVDPLTYLQ